MLNFFSFLIYLWLLCNTYFHCKSNDASLEKINQWKYQNNGFSHDKDYMKENGFEKNNANIQKKIRKVGFLRRENGLISSASILKIWKKSEVNKWTSQNVVWWIENVAELPQYKEIFLKRKIDGNKLLKVVLNPHILFDFGIIDPLHRQKLILSALEMILFGYKKTNYFNNLILFSILISALLVSVINILHKNKVEKKLDKAYKKINALKKTKEKLSDLKQQLEVTKVMQAEKKILDEKLQSRKIKKSKEWIKNREKDLLDQIEINKARIDEIVDLEKTDISQIEFIKLTLQSWLQKTYNIEMEHLNQEKKSIMQQLNKKSVESIDKARNKKRFTHKDTINHNLLLKNYAKLKNEIKLSSLRWNEIEGLCGFDIRNNNRSELSNSIRTKLQRMNSAPENSFIFTNLSENKISEESDVDEDKTISLDNTLSFESSFESLKSKRKANHFNSFYDLSIKDENDYKSHHTSFSDIHLLLNTRKKATLPRRTKSSMNILLPVN